MAHLHFRRTVYKSGGTKAAGRLAYITGEREQPSSAEEQLAYVAGQREDLVFTETHNLPAWAAGNPTVFFRAAEQYEGGGAQRAWNAFEEWKVTLPQELTMAQNTALVADMMDLIAGDQLPYTVALHNPRTLDGTQDQPHFHLLISARRGDAYPRTAAAHFKRYNRQDPHKGGAQKDPAFWAKGAVKQHRVMLSDMLNVHLERHGLAVRVHPDTLLERGMARDPEPKLLPSEGDAYRKQGIVSPTMMAVLASRQARATEPPREQNNARQYWEQRKAFLGITRDMPHDQKLAHILLKRHGTAERVPTRYRRLLAPSRVQGRRREGVGQVQRLALVLVAQLEDTHAQGKLRVRLHEPERDQGIGI
jgi:hypothetical protein